MAALSFSKTGEYNEGDRNLIGHIEKPLTAFVFEGHNINWKWRKIATRAKPSIFLTCSQKIVTLPDMELNVTFPFKNTK